MKIPQEKIPIVSIDESRMGIYIQGRFYLYETHSFFESENTEPMIHLDSWKSIQSMKLVYPFLLLQFSHQVAVYSFLDETTTGIHSQDSVLKHSCVRFFDGLLVWIRTLSSLFLGWFTYKWFSDF